ncbi:MAG: hypothetical protein V3U49_02780 [Nitrososphaerales archaeon]
MSRRFCPSRLIARATKISDAGGKVVGCLVLSSTSKEELVKKAEGLRIPIEMPRS